MNPTSREYFFDRHRSSFASILYYYQSGGTLACPPNIPLHIFIKELVFFDIGDAEIEQLQIDHGIKEAPVEVHRIYFYTRLSNRSQVTFGMCEYTFLISLHIPKCAEWNYRTLLTQLEEGRGGLLSHWPTGYLEHLLLLTIIILGMRSSKDVFHDPFCLFQNSISNKLHFSFVYLAILNNHGQKR